MFGRILVVLALIPVAAMAAPTIEAPAAAPIGSEVAIKVAGSSNPKDFVTIVPKSMREGGYDAYAYIDKAGVSKLRAPAKPGDYEIRVLGAESPEPVPDDIAKQTLTKLTSSTIPAGTGFALRVFGREADSCQTDLDIPVAPLNPAAASARIATLEAKNNAKTPIGASLAQVTDDLRGVTGERLVILVTDGEETCGGDPAASIEALKNSGIAVRLNIVGFAVDEPAIAATFRRWTDAGGGLYFDARDTAGLGTALALAVRRSFEVVDAQGHVLAEGLAGGEPVSVNPGDHTVRLKGSKGAGKKVTVHEKETVQVSF